MAFDAFALILSMLALGLLFQRLRLFPDNAAEVLNKVVLYVCLPAAVLTYVPRLQLDASLLGVVATPWILTVATVALVADHEVKFSAVPPAMRVSLSVSVNDQSTRPLRL